MKHQGFSLIEALLYIALCCMTTGFLCTFAVQLHTRMQNIITHNARLMHWYAAYDFLLDDLAQITSEEQIKTYTPQKIVYRSGTKTVSWMFRKGTLVRKEVEQHAKSRAVIAHFVEHIHFDYAHGIIRFALKGCHGTTVCNLQGAYAINDLNSLLRF